MAPRLRGPCASCRPAHLIFRNIHPLPPRIDRRRPLDHLEAPPAEKALAHEIEQAQHGKLHAMRLGRDAERTIVSLSKRSSGSRALAPPAWNRCKQACPRLERGGAQNQAIGRSRGGLTTKIMALADALGNLVRFTLLGDKAFGADWLREGLDGRDAVAVIPSKGGRVEPVPHHEEMYQWRHLAGNFF